MQQATRQPGSVQDVARIVDLHLLREPDKFFTEKFIPALTEGVFTGLLRCSTSSSGCSLSNMMKAGVLSTTTCSHLGEKVLDVKPTATNALTASGVEIFQSLLYTTRRATAKEILEAHSGVWKNRKPGDMSNFLSMNPETVPRKKSEDK
eukprot:GSA120T00016953001.1